MGRKVKQLKNYTSEEVKALIDNDDKHKVGVKLCAVYQMSKGKSSRVLEDFFQVSFKQICNWATRFDNEGIEGLVDKPRSGRKPNISAEQKAELSTILKSSPEAMGYNSGSWSGPLVKDLLKNHFGLEYSISHTYNLLHLLGFSFQRTKGVYPERDETKREVVRAEIKKT